MDVAQASTGAADGRGGSSSPNKALHRRWASDTWTLNGPGDDAVRSGRADSLKNADYEDIMSGLLDVEGLAAAEEDLSGKHKDLDGADGAQGDYDDVGDDDLKDLKEDDPRRAKRIIANRQSAQRSRMRKLQYTEELEKSVQRLHTEINQLTPQVTLLKNKQNQLSDRNKRMRQRIQELMQETQYKDQMNAALRDEVQRIKGLRELGGSGAQQPSSMPSVMGSSAAAGAAVASMASSAAAGKSRQASGQQPQQVQQQQQQVRQQQQQVRQQQQQLQRHQVQQQQQQPPSSAPQQGQHLMLGLDPATRQMLLSPQQLQQQPQQLSSGGNFLLINPGQGSLLQPLPPGLAMTHHAASQAMSSPHGSQVHAQAVAAAAAGHQAMLSAATAMQPAQQSIGGDPNAGGGAQGPVVSASPGAAPPQAAPRQRTTSQAMTWT